MSDLDNAPRAARDHDGAFEHVSHFLRWHRSAVLRGGRITKFKGVAASYSPEMGLVDAGPVGQNQPEKTPRGLARNLLRWTAAPVAMLAAGTPAMAQDACVEVNPGEWVCQDNGASATTEQTISGSAVTVAIQDGFAVDTSGGAGDGLNVTSSTSLDIYQASGSSSIVGNDWGIYARNNGGGALSISAADVSGVNVDGIYAINSINGTDLTIDSSAGSVSGYIRGIWARNDGSGSLSITTADVTGSLSLGIYARNLGGGDLTIDSSAGTVSSGGYGIAAFNFTGGALSITTADVTGVMGRGILVRNYGTDLVIDSSAGSVSGGIYGIWATNYGSGALSITTGDVTGGSRDGIFARNYGTDLVIDSSAGKVSGATIGINAVNFGSGTVSIVSADVTRGIYARNYNGIGLTIDSSAGSVTGGYNGIYARNANGALSITTADVTNDNSNGIVARNDGTDLTIDSSAGSVSGGSNGIYASNFGSGALSITTADVSGTSISGIWARNINGTDLTIDSSAGSVSSGIYGISAINYGSGALSITTADVSGTGANGIFALNRVGTDLTIDSSAGSVSGGSNGIYASNFGSGALSITTADVSATGSNGIFARNIYGTDLTVDSSAGSVSGGSSGGISAVNTGSGALSITTADVTGASFVGIYAINSINGTDLTIDSSAGSVSGGFTGIFARNRGSGALSITAADVTGTSFVGIDANNSINGTDLTIDSSAGSVTGTQGISAINYGSGALSITTADVSGTGADGIWARNINGTTDLTIDSSAGSVSGGRNGIYASNFGSGALSITTADVTGTGNNGIWVRNLVGTDLAIDSSAGSVSGGSYGISAVNTGSGALSITTGDVTGTSISGIWARNINGTDLTIDSSAGSVSGGSSGIWALNQGSGALSITTADVSATNFVGIWVSNINGTDLTIDSSAGSVSGGSRGIWAINQGSGALSITTADVSGAEFAIQTSSSSSGPTSIDIGGTVSGGIAGIAIDGSAGPVSISNSGTLSGGSWAILANAAITAPISISSSGTLLGGVSLGAGDDTLTNEAGGLFYADQDSNFGAGNDVLDNFGTFVVNGNVTMLGLEQFNNRNVVTMVDGAANDSLTLPGGYLAASDLKVDVDFGAGTADKLIIGGTVTGTTHVLLNDLTSGGGLGQAVVVVDAAAGVAADAFVLSPDQASFSPFLAYRLQFDAANNDFLASLALAPRALEMTKIAEAAQSLWYRSADAWSDHRANARFGDHKAPLWLTFYGATADRDDGFSSSAGIVAGDAVLDYKQDYFGFQAGLDLVGNEQFGFGITAGYLSSRMKLAADGNQANFDVFNIGAAASYQDGGLFAELLLKYDVISGNLVDRVEGGLQGDLDGHSYGGRLELGYRLDGKAFYIQPHASIEFQRSDLDDLLLDAEQSFRFDGMDGLRGKAGLRIGIEDSQSTGTVLGYYLDASAVHEFKGDGPTRFTLGDSAVDLYNNAINTYAHIEAGMKIDGHGPLSGFFHVEGDVSRDYTSYGAKAGIRIAF